jgi:hypothetical protein
MEEFPDEETIANCASAYSGDIFCMSDVIRFLNINNFQKPPNMRMICWLVALKLLPPERIKWIPEILKLSNYYKRCLERYVDDCLFTPLDSVASGAGGLIRDTIQDSLPWFTRFARAFGIKDSHLADAELRLQRIFTVICHDAQKFEYHAGYQSYGCVAYVVALSFATKGGLPLCFAEAMAAHMCRAFMSVAAMTRHFDELRASTDHFDDLRRLIGRFCPSVATQFTNAKLDLIAFTLAWERNMFADQHSPYNLLLIWDHILFHIREYRKFMRFLIVAHLRMMVGAGIDFRSDEEIYEMKWNAMEMLDDIEELQQKDKINPYKIVLQIMCPCFPFMQKYVT